MKSARPLPDRPRFAVLLFVLFLLVCALGGGASRADVAASIAVRLAAIAVLAFACLRPPPSLRPVRAPLLLLLALAATIVLQLVPLPPALWTRLPGHGVYVQAASAAGIAQPWRPINLTPDMGWNSLLALLPPLGALIGFAMLDATERLRLLPVLVTIALASAVIGVIQLSQGPSSDFYLFDVTNHGSAVGLFANRNHQALLLALTLPALAVLASFGDSGAHRVASLACTMAAAVALLPVILVTGSRAGLLLAVIGIVSGVLLVTRPVGDDRRVFPRWAYAMPIAAGVAIVALTIVLARATALKRLFHFVPGEETRIGLIAPLWRLVRDFLPFGSGFGSFETMYRQQQSFGTLSRLYLNHAHNDAIEVAIEGGLPGIAILAVFLAWWGRSAVQLWSSRASGSRRRRLARLGSVMVLMTLAASLPDYPLRTPLLAVVMAIACAWMADENDKARVNRPGV